VLVCRYADGGRHGYGRVEHDRDSAHIVPVEYDRRAGRWVQRSGRARPISEIALLPPADPSKIVCVALNYQPEGRAAAGIRPSAGDASAAVVLKPPSSLIGPGDPVTHPGDSWELKHEAELALVIGVRCRKVPPTYAGEVVAGYTCANDITAYPRRYPDDRPVWAKHFDGLTPLGPWLATDLDPADVEITCSVDGETRQRGSTRDLIRPVPDVVALVSEHMTLLPGDVILTGTPAGSGPLSVGSRVEVSIAGVGTLRNIVDMPSGAPWAPRAAANGATAEQVVAGHAVSEKGRAGDADR
jgi:2-keto-4-pentenoate hydratase/2-oxohepta-3-ene-1,7-dioic acid hydratase in catechol pathway